MKIAVTPILMFLLTFTLSARNGANSPFAMLDNEINNKYFYDHKKEQELAELKQLLKIKDITPEQEYDINLQLSKKYRKYMIDSTICYVKKNLIIAKALNRIDLINEQNLYLSQLYSAAGMYIESLNILKSINRQNILQTTLPLYFESYSLFYAYYAQSNNQRIYFKQNEVYKDSLLSVLDRQSLSYNLTYLEKLLFKNQTDVVEQSLLSIFEQLPKYNSDYAYVAYLLGIVYEKKRDVAQQKKYLALSAIADIKNSIKDHASLKSLALIYYAENDIVIAYKYMKSSIDDIEFCNARFRAAELSSVYSIINTAYLAKEIKQKDLLLLFLVLISTLSFLLLITILYIYKQMRKVSKIQKELTKTNNKQVELNKKLTELNQSLNEANCKLKNVNDQLLEANHVKEIYIAHFFELCSTYIDKMETYRNKIIKAAANNSRSELIKQLGSTSLTNSERQELYAQFDTIFLNLYPTFVEEFNAMLAKDGQAVLKQGELLNKELRIYALIRLGVTDSVKIAEFLRYSLSTIYNYRTNVRNKAIVARDKFDEMVMQIGNMYS